jgi:quercetin dioxygenase-like cupin family protein
MFYEIVSSGYRKALEGVRYKTLVHGERTLLAEFHLDGGAVVPTHAHPHEQTGYVVSGHMAFTIGDDHFDAVAGTSWCIPGNMPHGVTVLEDTVVIEVFSPVRQEYLPERRR